MYGDDPSVFPFPALVQIANAMNMSLDELVCDSIHKAKAVFENEITRSVQDCSEQEIRVIADTIIALKNFLRNRTDNTAKISGKLLMKAS